METRQETEAGSGQYWSSMSFGSLFDCSQSVPEPLIEATRYARAKAVKLTR